MAEALFWAGGGSQKRKTSAEDVFQRTFWTGKWFSFNGFGLVFRTLDNWFFSDTGPVVSHRLADTKKWF